VFFRYHDQVIAYLEFSVKVGTIFEDSPIGLDKWVQVMWMLVDCRNGVSSWEIHRATGVTQKTAWFMLQHGRLAMQDENTGGKPARQRGGTSGMDVNGELLNDSDRFVTAMRQVVGKRLTYKERIGKEQGAPEAF
jgi:hypothetical protein